MWNDFAWMWGETRSAQQCGGNFLATVSRRTVLRTIVFLKPHIALLRAVGRILLKAETEMEHTLIRCSCYQHTGR